MFESIMKKLMCLLLLIFIVGCPVVEVFDDVAGTDFQENPPTVAEGVGFLKKAAQPAVDAAKSNNWLGFAFAIGGGLWALIQTRRKRAAAELAILRDTQVRAVIGGIRDAGLDANVAKTLANSIKHKAVAEGVETGPDGLSRLVENESANVANLGG